MSYIALAGANSPALHHFTINTEGNPDRNESARQVGELHFQDGPIGENGNNGTTNEEMIQLLVDRVRSLNEMSDRKYACRENSLAITHLEEALHWLQARTSARLRRGVEGTSTP